MRTRSLYALGFLPLGAWLTSCDNITAGQLEDDPGPPVLLKILVQDEVTNTGRVTATDILDKTPQIKCSEKDPCPAGDGYAHPACAIPDGQTEGVCPDPLKPEETPVQVGVPTNCGGVQFRLVWSKVLDSNAIEKAEKDAMTGAIKWTLTDGVIDIVDAGGKSLNFHPSLSYPKFPSTSGATRCAKFYEPGGSPTLTADMFRDPYGPALIMKPRDQLIVESQYTIKIDATKIKDRKGQSPAKDVNGPIQASYTFTTEALHPLDGQLSAIGSGQVEPADVIGFQLNAGFDPGTLKVTVTDKDGKTVPSVASPALGGDPKKCADNEDDSIIVVFAVDKDGMRTTWAEGTYKVTVEAASLDNPKAMLKTLATGKATFKETSFTVKKTLGSPDESMWFADGFVMPDECVVAPPPDMAKPAQDMAMTPAGDMSMPVDGGNGG